MITPDQIRNAAKFGQSLRNETLIELAEFLEAADAVLLAAREKLRLYRAEHSGNYVGGVEFTDLDKRITALINQQKAKHGS